MKNATPVNVPDVGWAEPTGKKGVYWDVSLFSKEDLMTDWRLAVSGQNPLPIKPLE